jgi:hypothetical protein
MKTDIAECLTKDVSSEEIDIDDVKDVPAMFEQMPA